MSEQRPRRWVCCNNDGWVTEMLSLERPSKGVDGDWRWVLAADGGEILFRGPVEYERLTGINIEHGEGPIELEVRVKE